SRAARVPSGKSHRGRSPSSGLYTHRTCGPAASRRHRKVMLLAVVRRPRISMGAGSSAATAPATVRAARPGPASGPRSESPRASAGRSDTAVTGELPIVVAGCASVSVGAHAHVALGIQRLAAQRAGRAAGLDDQFGARGELARLGRIQK